MRQAELPRDLPSTRARVEERQQVQNCIYEFCIRFLPASYPYLTSKHDIVHA